MSVIRSQLVPWVWPQTTEAPSPVAEEVSQLFEEFRSPVLRYILSLGLPMQDAEDILQEVKMFLWRQFDKFEAGSNFRAWARTIATHQILNYRRAVKKRIGASLDDAFVEAVAMEIDRQGEGLERRSDALLVCVRKLPEAHRKIVQWRYYEDCSVAEIAGRTQRTTEAVYRLLSRIRAVLSDCVVRQTAEQGGR